MAPRARIILRRSTENVSVITATNGYPLTAQTMASAIPVLPEVASTTVCPAFNRPFFSASLMIAKASRSLTEASGLKYSALTYISTSLGANLLILITGVLPIVSRIES